MAVQLLVGRIRAENAAPPVKVLVGGRLVERGSVRVLADGAAAGVGASRGSRRREARDGGRRGAER
jgi:hypothetical protein